MSHQPERKVVPGSTRRSKDERGRMIPVRSHPTLPGREIVEWDVLLDGCFHVLKHGVDEHGKTTKGLETAYDNLEGDSTTAPHKPPEKARCPICPPEEPPAPPRPWWDRALRWLLGA